MMPPKTASNSDASRLAIALRAFRHRNFRLFTAGQSISLVGTWMQQVAIGWLVYRLTGSAFLLGLVSFVSLGPGFFIAPIAGELADRFNKHRIVIAAQAAMMVQALVLGGLVVTDRIDVGWIIVLMGTLGIASGFDVPTRQAFLIDMVGDREDLPNAIALNSSIFNAARLVGPAIAGFAIAAVGEGWVILINGVSYIAVIASLLAMRLPPPTRARGRGAVLRRVGDGFTYAWHFTPIRVVLALVGVIGLLGVPFTVLLPVIATDVLHGGPRTLGLLMSATGLGALSGALFLASRRSVRGLGRVIVVTAVLFGTSLVLLAFARSVAVAIPLLALAGFGMMAQMASSNTVLQTLVQDDMRGRVMSFYSMAHMGTAPLGSLIIGLLAGRIGAPAAIGAGGAACVVAGLYFGKQLPILREIVRPIYARMGILPEVARGLQAATHQATTDTDDGPLP
ncbi:MAG: MFS transporter [Gemmatimonadota bacterium]